MSHKQRKPLAIHFNFLIALNNYLAHIKIATLSTNISSLSSILVVK